MVGATYPTLGSGWRNAPLPRCVLRDLFGLFLLRVPASRLGRRPPKDS